jgi:hypothetical protein
LVFPVVSSGFPTNILYAFIFPPIRATCPAQGGGVGYLYIEGRLVRICDYIYLDSVINNIGALILTILAGL